MAERGEGAAPQGGSHTRNFTSGNCHTTRNKLPLASRSEIVGSGEGVEGTSSPLPLRKRKFTISDSVTSRRSDTRKFSESSCVIAHTSSSLTSPNSSSKRRRLTAGGSTGPNKDNLQISGNCTVENSETSPLVKKRRGSHPESKTPTSGSLAAQAPDTPSRGQSSTASPPPQRSSTRVSVSPGFYTDIEQRFRVAEWERAWSRSTEKKRTSAEETERSPGGGGILKAYPLRNRLRLSEGNHLNVGGTNNNGSSGSLNAGNRGAPLGADPPNHLPPHQQHHHPSHSPQQQQSQSLPSSPSSPGVAFLADTFRRLRDSRRSSQEPSTTSNSSRRSGQSKETSRQNTGSWKKGHATRKSPLSKRNSRGKTNNTGSCASSSQHSSRCTKVGLGSSAGMSGSHGGLPGSSSGNPAQACAPGSGITQPPGTINMTVSAPSVAVSASGLAGIMTSGSSASASTLLPPSSLASLGAIGGSSSSAAGSSGGPGGIGASGTLAGFMGGPTDSESEENEMGRLEALLASRGLPPSLFGALGPRMHHILHRSVSSSISSRAQQLLVGLQATGDESEQLQAVIEMCQLLVMGNEDTLAGFPIKQVTPALINLLNMDHNFDMMNHACRALTYMMEALPRSSSVVVDAVPIFLEKLQVIQCMDVAEQSLTALDMLSRKHSKAILQAHGVSACLTYIDFFSSGAQRAALSITANCCQNLTADEFHFIADSLSLLSSRLTSQGEKKCVESVCLAYSRLVDCFQNDPNRLQEIAGHNLLSNIQQLLVMSPPVLSSSTFIMVMRMMSLMCANCPELAVTLLNNNIANTLCYLLTSSAEPPGDQVELVSRSPQELYEITCLIGELMPSLPSEGMFAIDGVLQRPTVSVQDTLTWQWLDDRSNWQSYSPSDSRIIEQINDTTGTVRAVQHRLVPAGTTNTSAHPAQVKDARAVCLENNSDLSFTLIRSLFSLLYEVYSSSAGPAVRYKCLRALLRMVHFSSPQLLQQVLKSQAVSSHLATMLSSLDLKIIVGALQMADLLMCKLPDVFAIYFRREGVMHQIKRLSDPETTIGSTQVSKMSFPDIGSVGSSTPNSASPLLPGRPFNGSCRDSTPTSGGSVSSYHEDEKLNSPSQMRLSDVLKRKRSKTTARMHCGGVWRRTRQDDNSTSTFSEFLMKNTGLSNSRENWRSGSRNKLMTGSNSSSGGGSGRTASSFLANFNPVRWGRCNSSTPSHDLHNSSKERNSSNSLMTSSNSSTSSNNSSLSGLPPSSHSSSNREMIRTWVREQAQRLNEQHFSTELKGATHPALTVLNRLIAAIQQLEHQPSASILALREISEIVSESDISPFEVIHSGLVRCLITYLTATDSASIIPPSFSMSNSLLGVFGSSILGENGGSAQSSPSLSNVVKTPRDSRIRNFLHVFLGCSVNALNTDGYDIDKVPALSALISKLNGCVNQLEQFPVKVHDLPGSVLAGSGRGGSTSAIKFFNTHQLKCNLQRHPDCSRLRQWRGGPVKVDPLALVQAIERYLVIRGYGRLRDDDDDNSDDDNSDEDVEDTLAAVSVNQSSSCHKLQFMIGDHVLPYNMTVYQAIRQFSSNDASTSEADTDSEMPVSHSAIWLQTHVIYYRPVQEEDQVTTSSGRPGRKGKSSSSKPSPKKKHDVMLSEGSIVGGSKSVLEAQLCSSLPASVTVRDPSVEVLGLLRVLYALNRHYGLLYPPALYKPPIPISEFTNLKLTAKANRQLQDPLVIMTGNLPPWLPQIAYACPFLFPFETRQLLFYAVSFDRDRALQRLIDSAPELNPSDSSERVTPRLERRKRTVSRDDILKQAEAVISDLASSRAMLEIQYDNEVGTGLGPTLEFYALVSKELLKADLELWRGDTVTIMEGTKDIQVSKAVKYMSISNSLYPLPLPRSTKFVYVSKLKSKFKFLGKFMAKAVMDSRMLDLGLHECVYKWLLGEERSLGLGDVISLDPNLGNVLLKLQKMVLEKKKMQDQIKGDSINSSDLQEKLEKLTIDGCSIEDLALNFTLPGYPNIELRRGGSDTTVTVNNIEQYLQLVVDWFLREGVWRQMEALREGFECVFPIAQLQIFYPEELELLFCGANDKSIWDMKQLAECCRPDHGYTHDSRAVKCLLEILASYSGAQQRSFLQFVTGSPRLPVGGFRSLSPPLTIVRKTFDTGENPDNYLPSVMTCVNYLKLPDYSTIDIMRAKLEIAAREGQHSFHLS